MTLFRSNNMTSTRTHSMVSLSVAAAIACVTGATSLVAPSTAGAQPVVSDTGLGQALIAPYYTVNGSWQTNFNLINTSNRTVAVKVRFHEHKNSRDVLDFNIIMSPYDAWTGYLDDTPDGPALFTSDETCTSPTEIDGALLSSFAYTGSFNDNGGDGLGRMRQGYVEFLVMGIAPDETADVPFNAEHVDGIPRDCAAVDAAFVATEGNWPSLGDVSPTDIAYNANPINVVASPQEYGSGNPTARADFASPAAACATTTPAANDTCENPLKGNVTWLNVGTGTGAGGAMIAVSDWLEYNFVTAQQFPWFLEPTFASSQGLWTIGGAADFDASIDATATLNEWANNPGNGAATEMVLTFPTKAFHVDNFPTQIQAARNDYRDLTGVDLAPFEENFNGESTITVSYDIYDREENSASFEVGTTVSPAPPVPLDAIKFEANVISFGDASLLGSPTASSIDAASLVDAPNGWVQVNFKPQGGLPGLPVVGFVVKGRTLLEATSSYGQAMQNGYVRPAAD